MWGRRVAMHRWFIGTSLFLATGCWSTGPSLKPPPHPEEYLVPPTEESKWSAPVEYPKGTLFTDVIKKKDGPGMGSGSDPTRFGSGPGMGGRGY